MKRGPTGGTFLLVGIVQVDDVEVLASFVAVKERHGSILVRIQRLSASKEVGLGAAIGREMDLSGGEERRKQEVGREGRVDRERERWKEGERGKDGKDTWRGNSAE